MKSIKIKLVTFIGSLLLIVCVGLGVIFYYNSKNALEENANVMLPQIATQGAKVVDTRIQRQYTYLTTIATLDSIRSSQEPLAKKLAFLNGEAQRTGSLLMGISDMNGNCKFSDGSTLDIKDRDYFKKALAGETVISDPLISSLNKALILVIATPIKENNVITGVLTLLRDGNALSDISKDIIAGESGKSFMLRKDGTTIAHTDKNLVLNMDNDLKLAKPDPALNGLIKLEKKMVSGETGSGKYTYKGVSKYLGYAPIPGTEWSIGVNVPQTEILVSLSDLKKTIIITVLIFMVLSLCIIYLIAKGISTPIKKLNEISDQLAIGNVNVEVTIARSDEIGELANSFKTMVKNIKEQTLAAEKIASGDFNVELQPKSEKDILSIALNNVITTVSTIVNNMQDKLIIPISNGDFTVRGNEELYSGEWSRLIKGINGLINSFVEPIKLTSKYLVKVANGETFEEIESLHKGEFKILIDNLNLVNKSLSNLLSETLQLSKAGVNGDLSQRADLSKVKGGYVDILKGMNETIDAIIAPIKEATLVLDEIGKGNLKARIQGDFKGEHTIIKTALNNTTAGILNNLAETSRILTEIAEGNLDITLSGEFHGDFIQLKNAINIIVESLNSTLTEINSGADQVSSGADQVSESSQALSEGSTEQASAIEQITASMEQIAAQTKQNAMNADRANQLTVTARDNASKGNSQMSEMLSAMTDINTSSASISKIIKVIDEIAFQTNILALNAAVEAARAGQHGKGFTVVAEEVRNLAARSADAAKETTAMIEGSIIKVAKGTKIANDTADALIKIVENISIVANLVGDIAVASNEQASGISQINQAIELVSTVTQTNTSTAEESAAASQELSSQSMILKNMVSKFKLKKVRQTSGVNALDAETMKLFQEMMKNQNKHPEQSFEKAKISLDDRNFDKY